MITTEGTPTRSAADIVKSSVPIKTDKKQTTIPADKNEPFPTLCQTTDFKANSSSYADILKNKK